MDISGHSCGQKVAEKRNALVCKWVFLLYLSGLFTRCLEFSLLASLSDLLVLGETVAVLSTRWVVLFSQDLPTRQNKESKTISNGEWRQMASNSTALSPFPLQPPPQTLAKSLLRPCQHHCPSSSIIPRLATAVTDRTKMPVRHRTACPLTQEGHCSV